MDYEWMNDVDFNEAAKWMLWVVLNYGLKEDCEDEVKAWCDEHGTELFDFFNTTVYSYVKDRLYDFDFLEMLASDIEDEDEISEFAKFINVRE